MNGVTLRVSIATLVFVVISQFASAQSIFTVAGGTVGDGRPSTQGSINAAIDVATDSEGNVFFADQFQDRIRRIDAVTGIISTVAGNGQTGAEGDGGPAVAASLNQPSSVAVDAEGNVFIADESNRIRRVDAVSGIITTVAGNGEAGFSGDGGLATEASLNSPSGVTVDADGNIFIVDRLNERIRKVDGLTGIITSYAGNGESGFSGDGGPATSASLRFSLYQHPCLCEPPFEAVPGVGDVAVDSDGNLFIADTFNFRVRRVDAITRVISTFAGGGELGNGSPANQAFLGFVVKLWVDTVGAVFFAENEGDTIANDADNFLDDDAIRRVDPISGIISTVAGEDAGYSGDGGPATEARLLTPWSVAVDAAGNVLIADTGNARLRKIDAGSGLIDTIAGAFPGDGFVATEGSLTLPQGIGIDAEGNLYIADRRDNRVRRVDAETGRISTYAGTGLFGRGPGRSGVPAIEDAVPGPSPVAIDSEGNVCFGQIGYPRVRCVDQDGIIFTLAGTGNLASTGDGGPARNASIMFPWGIAFDPQDNLYISGNGFVNGPPDEHEVRRVDGVTGIITTYAGAGPIGFSGDGGPATAALLDTPLDVVTDELGNLFIADTGNRRVRRVDVNSRIIETVAVFDEPVLSVAYDDGYVYVGLGGDEDGEGSTVQRIDLQTSSVTQVAGNGRGEYTGDAGPAIDAGIRQVAQMAFDESANLFLVDQVRVRAVFACADVGEPTLLQPASGVTLDSGSPILEWSEVDGAFSYDVYLSAGSNAVDIVASDLTSPRFIPANLEPGTAYAWRVVAKGDPFCEPRSESTSSTLTFVTPDACVAPPAVSPSTPADGETVSETSHRLRWSRTPGAGAYVVYLGTTSPPPLYRVTATTTILVDDLVPGITYYWAVGAQAGCNPSQIEISDLFSFDVAGSCESVGEVDLLSPSIGAMGLPIEVDLEWTDAPGASSYDLYLGTSNPPPFVTSSGSSTRVTVSSLLPGETYYWQVRANADCGGGTSDTSPVRSFTTGTDCPVPGQPRFSATPFSTVGVGQTYVLGWNRVENLGAGGGYLIERSLDSDFSTLLDSQRTLSTTALFVAEEEGTLHHRVRAVSGCDDASSGPYSSAVKVESIRSTVPKVVFSVEPEAVFVEKGRRIEEITSSFSLENLGLDPIEVSLTGSRIDSIPFFTIRDPLGDDLESLVLEPREPRTFEVRFSGPPNDVEASYQGLIVVSTSGAPVTTYAFVNLKIGTEGGVAPEIRFEGIPTGFAFFPGFSGDDTNRAPISLEIHNAGSSDMELAAEIGPEVWIELEDGWNATPIPAGGTRTVELFTRRKQAPAGSALPRYTFLTFRTSNGEESRVIVQDSDLIEVGSGRGAALGQDVRTLIVPEVVSEEADDSTLVSQVSLSNLGSNAARVDLIFTPEGSDGFGEDVVRVPVVIPANDVAVLTDPLTHVMNLDRPARGQIEVVSFGDSIDRIRVESSVVAIEDVDTKLRTVPVVERGSGARDGVGHRVSGITTAAGSATSLVLAETSGLDGIGIQVDAYDEGGSLVATETVELERYDQRLLESFVPGGVASGWIDLTATGGGGSAIGVAVVSTPSEPKAATIRSRVRGDELGALELRRLEASARTRGPAGPREEVTRTLVAPYVASGIVDASGIEWKTVVGFVAPPGGLDFEVTFTDRSGAVTSKAVSVPASTLAGAIIEFDDVISDLFGLPTPIDGSIAVTAPPTGSVYARLATASTTSEAFDLVSSISEFVVGGDNRRPLAIEGLQQSTDPTRGARWNLYAKEIAGEDARVRVQLYEPGNRVTPIAVRDFDVPAGGQVALESVFDSLGLSSTGRSKDRVNVLCVVTPTSGAGEIVATAIEIDNETRDATPHLLGTGNVDATEGVSRVLVDIVDPTQSGRRRPVRGD